MTKIRAGVVDVIVIRPLARRWQVLALRRAPGVRRARSWEVVHGSVEPGEKPVAAALREVREETGLAVRTLYSITVNPFYLYQSDTVQLALVFAAFVEDARVAPSDEHDAFEWLSVTEASRRFAWPREVEALSHIRRLLKSGDAGAVDDVLRVFG